MTESSLKKSGNTVITTPDFSSMLISIPNSNGTPTSGMLAPVASPRKTSLGSFDLSFDDEVDNDDDTIPGPRPSMEVIGAPEPLALPLNAFPSTSPNKTHTMLSTKTLCKGRLYTNSNASMSLRKSGKVTHKQSRLIFNSQKLHKEATTSLKSIRDQRKSLRYSSSRRVVNEPLSASAITAAFFRAAAERRKSTISTKRFIDTLPELADAKN